MRFRGASLLPVALVALFLLPLNAAENVAAIFAAGQAALTHGDLPAAEASFRRCLALEPDSLPARANLGVVYMRQKQWTAALTEFGRAEQKAPGNAGLELNIGLALFHLGEYQKAAPRFEAVLESDPQSLQARYLAGLCLFASENYPEAVRYLEPLWSAENNQLPYLYVLALTADKAGRSALEQQALEQMYRVGKDTAEYHLFLGRAWMMRQRDADAAKELEEAARIDTRLPFVHYSLGLIHESAGDYQTAKTDFLADAAVEPQLALNYQELGSVYLKLQQPADAKRNLLEAVTLDSHDARTLLNLAKLEREEGQYAQALHYLEAAERLDSDSASLHYLKAQTLIQLRRSKEAAAEFAASSRLRQSTRDRLEEQVSGRTTVDAQIGFPQ